jgi:uncharacterized protein YcbK (DUF882 family)
MNIILMEGIQVLRDEVGMPLNPSSGFRCNTHNESDDVKGTPGSFHTLGMAADIPVPEEMTIQEFYKIADQIQQFSTGGIIAYREDIHRLHLDVGMLGRRRFEKIGSGYMPIPDGYVLK